ncbi:unnamed protein product, partial [Amoebophrya sp. A120]
RLHFKGKKENWFGKGYYLMSTQQALPPAPPPATTASVAREDWVATQSRDERTAATPAPTAGADGSATGTTNPGAVTTTTEHHENGSPATPAAGEAPTDRGTNVAGRTRGSGSSSQPQTIQAYCKEKLRGFEETLRRQEVRLSGVQETLQSHTLRRTELETDNTKFRTDLENLRTECKDHTDTEIKRVERGEFEAFQRLEGRVKQLEPSGTQGREKGLRAARRRNSEQLLERKDSGDRGSSVAGA